VEEAVIAYKFLRADGTSPFTRFAWPLPDGAPGAWVEARVEPCRSGIHACRARLLRRLDAWDAAARDEYTRMCADRAHELAGMPSLAHWDAVIERSTRWGPALLGFMAARIAEERSGRDAYHAERARQVEWLAERLGLAA
jgi:hypothetical protein